MLELDAGTFIDVITRNSHGFTYKKYTRTVRVTKVSRYRVLRYLL